MRAGFFSQLVDDADIWTKDICRKKKNVASTTFYSQIIHDPANMSTNHFNIGSNINKYVLYVIEDFSMLSIWHMCWRWCVNHLNLVMGRVHSCQLFSYGQGENVVRGRIVFPLDGTCHIFGHNELLFADINRKYLDRDTLKRIFECLSNIWFRSKEMLNDKMDRIWQTFSIKSTNRITFSKFW